LAVLNKIYLDACYQCEDYEPGQLCAGDDFKMKTNMKIDEIRKAGLDALTKSLGPDGMIRFLQQFDSGNADYTKERQKWLGVQDVDTIYYALKKK
jgi:hypothetical protein